MEVLLVAGSVAVSSLRTPSGDPHEGGLWRRMATPRPGQHRWSAGPGSASERRKSSTGQSSGELPSCGSQWAELGQAEGSGVRVSRNCRPARERTVAAVQSWSRKPWAWPTCSALIRLLAPLVKARQRRLQAQMQSPPSALIGRLSLRPLFDPASFSHHTPIG